MKNEIKIKINIKLMVILNPLSGPNKNPFMVTRT